MSSRSTGTPRFASPTRLDVTDCPADRLDDRARANRVSDGELHLERRGGRTFLVATPTER
ncbi:hypothetical protein JCM17823_22530 [Halorubrum gandharaense]